MYVMTIAKSLPQNPSFFIDFLSGHDAHRCTRCTCVLETYHLIGEIVTKSWVRIYLYVHIYNTRRKKLTRKTLTFRMASIVLGVLVSLKLWLWKWRKKMFVFNVKKYATRTKTDLHSLIWHGWVWICDAKNGHFSCYCYSWTDSSTGTMAASFHRVSKSYCSWKN